LNDECSKRNALRIARRNHEKLQAERHAESRKSSDRFDEIRKRDDFRRRPDERFEEERRAKKSKSRKRDSGSVNF